MFSHDALTQCCVPQMCRLFMRTTRLLHSSTSFPWFTGTPSSFPRSRSENQILCPRPVVNRLVAPHHHGGQVEKIHELDEETGAALGAALTKVALKVVQATGADNYNVIVNNGKDSVCGTSFPPIVNRTPSFPGGVFFYLITVWYRPGPRSTPCALPHHPPLQGRLYPGEKT